MILTILIIVLGIALFVVYLNREKDEDKARAGIIGLTAAIVVLTIIRLIPSGSTGPVYDTALDKQLGSVAAERIAAVANGTSAIIVAPIGLKAPYLQARTEGFQEEFARRNITILGIEDAYPEVSFDPDSPPPPTEEGFDAYVFEQAIQNHPEADMLISIAGYPGRNFREVARDLQKIELYIFEEYSPLNWTDYLKANVIDGMILQHIDSNWTDTSGTPDEVFDRRYILVTRDNFDEMRPLFDDEPDYDW